MKLTKLQTCIAAMLLCTISCSKETQPVAEKQDTQTTAKTVAQTSAVTGYWKDNTTSVTTIDATPGYVKTILYTIGPISVNANDVVTVHFQQQTSYAGSDAVMIAGGVVIGDNSAVKDQLSSGFIGFASKHSGTNSTPEEGGTEVTQRTGSYKFTSAYSNVYINAVMYAANLSGNPPGAVDPTLPAGYGELVAVLESGVTRYETNSQAFVNMAVSGTTFVNKTLGPFNIAANTMVDTRYEAEATTAVPMPVGNYNQRFGRWVSEATSSSDQAGTRLIKPMQLGATHGEHHMTVSHAGGKFYPSAASNKYFNVITYGYGWGNPGYPLEIEQSTANNYGHYIIEMRNSTSGNLYEDGSANISSATSTPQVLYSVGPIDIAANQVVEVRYQAGLAPTAGAGYVTVVGKIIRATSPTATTGTEVLKGLSQLFHPYYTYTNLIHSTAERPSSALTGQYYNVVVQRTGGASSCPVLNWGELEVVKR